MLCSRYMLLVVFSSRQLLHSPNPILQHNQRHLVKLYSNPNNNKRPPPLLLPYLHLCWSQQCHPSIMGMYVSCRTGYSPWMLSLMHVASKMSRRKPVLQLPCLRVVHLLGGVLNQWLPLQQNLTGSHFKWRWRVILVILIQSTTSVSVLQHSNRWKVWISTLRGFEHWLLRWVCLLLTCVPSTTRFCRVSSLQYVSRCC